MQKRNKEKSPNKIFYFCGTCKQNLCPICKDYHSEKYNIINYDLKKYICFEHGDNYNLIVKSVIRIYVLLVKMTIQIIK